MVKSIIKRIIVGVGVALCLMAIKESGLICQVHAKESFYLTPDTANWSDNYDNTFNGNITLSHNKISGAKVHYFNWVVNANKAIINYHVPNSHSGVFDINFMLYSNAWTDDYNPVGTYILQNDHTYPCFVQSGSTAIGNSISGPTRMLHSVTCPNVNLLPNDFYVGTNSYSNVQNINPSVMNGLSDVILVSNNDVQQQLEEEKKQTEEQKKINNSLNDQSDANTSGFLQDINQDYSNNPVSDLITMPITFLQTLNNKANGSCITWDLGTLFGHILKMPCINLQQILGSNLYNLIDMAICLFLAYNIGLMCVTIWNNMTSLKDDFDDMYSPKHVYQGKHSGGDS